MEYEEAMRAADKALDDVQKFLVPYLFNNDMKNLDVLWNTMWSARKVLAEALESNDE